MIDDILKTYELENIHELITEITPKGYNASSLMIEIPDVQKYPDKTTVTVFGYIDKFEIVPMGKALSKIKARLYRNGEHINLSWISSIQKAKIVKFSLEKQAPAETLIQVTGKIDSFISDTGFRIISIDQPKLNAIGAISIRNDQKTQGFIVPEPLYVLKQGTTVFQIKQAFREVFQKIEKDRNRFYLPKELETTFGLKDLKQSLEYMHGFIPIQVELFERFVNSTAFNKRVNIEKIWRIILGAYLSHEEKNTPSINLSEEDVSLLKTLQEKLPFTLTEDQKKTIWGLLKQFSIKTGSKSLVFGDVGSGKTLVALFISYILFKQGYQVTIMTPTSILSKQHYEEALSLFGEGVSYLVHSKTKAHEKKKIAEVVESGKPCIVIGTSSINSMSFKNLKAIFIDEEQKMGVSAKEKLYREFNEEPHIIYMTATPIPRTLAASIFTNFSVFQIKTKPANRKSRITKIMYFDNTKTTELFEIEERMNNGEQTLVIVPSIDSNDMMNVSGTVKKYKKFFPKARITSINGRMNKDEVDEIIEKYMNGEFDILVATVMVDSGFSNKKISHVFIENADRFGISQLHQIRGRCGRGELQGYCYLVPGSENLKDLTKKRLHYITESEDGFTLSERDIELRGSGDLEGEKQSGLDLNFLDWIKEIDILREYIVSHLDELKKAVK